MYVVVLFWILESWVICFKDLDSPTFLRVLTLQQTVQLLAALPWTYSSALVGQYQAKAQAPHLPTHFPYRSCHSWVWTCQDVSRGIRSFLCPFYTLIKLCYTKALEWSSLVPGSEVKSSSEIMNLTLFTISCQTQQANSSSHLILKTIHWGRLYH